MSAPPNEAAAHDGWTATNAGTTKGLTESPFALVDDDPDGSPGGSVPASAKAETAVLYLRVSTPSQVKTDYDPEGISIPAQRDACKRKAAQLGIEVIDEYIEPGRSATSMDKRVAFQTMLERIRYQRDVSHVIVYKLSRMNRNRVDDALVLMSLRRYKVTLVSATEHIDATPTGQLMHGILAAFNEFRSAEDGADIRYKMGEKANRGGTISRAKLGYKNVRDHIDGRNIGTVVVDEERGPLIRLAFELYATGDYTLEDLSEALFDRGLRTRPGGRSPSGPISTSSLSTMLKDRYYVGFVTYQGEEFPGRHKALVSPDLFDRVQTFMDERSGRGTRQRRHHHYLKGSLWCGKCHEGGERDFRMIVARAVGHGGEYFYFFCRGRQEKVCDTHYLDMDQVEEAVARHYAQLRFPPDLIAAIRTSVRETVEDEASASALLKQHLTAELARLDTQEEHLLDLVEGGDLPSGKVRERLNRIKQQRLRLQQDAGEVDGRLQAGAALIEAALDLLVNPETLYRSAGPSERAMLNQAIFERLYVFQDQITDQEFRPPFADLAQVRRAVGTTKKGSTWTVLPSERGTSAGLLASVFLDGGSNRAAVVVEVAGIEPASFSFSTGLLRAQPVESFGLDVVTGVDEES
jgi:site-specific DNA recombinase